MGPWGVLDDQKLADQLVRCHRDLFALEAQLGEKLATSGLRIRRSIVDQWLILEEHLRLYGSGLSHAGLLVLAGRPDAGAAETGIPFTGPAEARAHLSLSTDAKGTSPAGALFWRAVREAQARAGDAPLESLFGTLLLAHAIPFDAPDEALPAMRRVCAPHVERILRISRPQLVLAVGADALTALAGAASHEALAGLALADESTWTARWPTSSRVSAYPMAETGGARFRVVPCPSLDGACASEASEILANVLAYAW